MRRRALLFLLLLAAASAQGPRKLKPGFNLFSKEQDIQLGKEAAAEIEKQVAVISHPDLAAYVRRIGDKLAAMPEAAGYPYTFKVVSDKSINAFALPGGPSYVHTGLLAAAENEAQVAGVLAHEISHVALRHGTNQVSKAYLFQLPALFGGLAGGGILGNLAQLGIGLGAGSVLLKFSRDAERDADLLGTRIMAGAGYNPIEMARFFEKLEAQGGSRGPQFLSDHPNPGNRVKAVQAEIRYLPQRSYTTGDAQDFSRIQRVVAGLPAPPPRAAAQQAGAAPLPSIRASSRLRVYTANSYRLSYPDNWQVVSEGQGPGVTIAPKEGVVENAIGVGALTGFHSPAGGRNDLRRDTDDLVRTLSASNPGMRAERSRDLRVEGQRALLVTLQSRSPFAGEVEIDSLLTVDRPEGLFYMILIAPKSLQGSLQPTFDAMIRSIRFSR